MGFTGSPGEEKGWWYPILCGLLEIKRTDTKDSYPFPRVDTTLNALSGLSWFCTLDLKSGYWQVEIDEQDREKTAFTAGSGLWQFNVMAFSQCSAPTTLE